MQANRQLGGELSWTCSFHGTAVTHCRPMGLIIEEWPMSSRGDHLPVNQFSYP